MKLLQTTILFLLVLLACNIARGQDENLKNRPTLEFNVGLWMAPLMSGEPLPSWSVLDKQSSSPLGGELLFAYPVKENLAATMSLGILEGIRRDLLSPLEDQINFLSPFMLGLRYFVAGPKSVPAMREYLSLALGTDLGYQISVQPAYTYHKTVESEFTLAGRFGAGLKYAVSSHLEFTLEVKFHIMKDFATPVGGRRSFNGLTLSVGSGLMF